MLILGGTGEARRLAAELPGRVISSLAGRVTDPRLPEGEVRVGGFGGVDGLVEWLRANGITAVVDATHPFAARITANAVEATARVGIPLLVLRRPGWTPEPGDDWRWVDSLEEAAADLPGDRVFLTTGRQDIGVFAGCGQYFLARSVEPPEPPLPRRVHVLLDRGPFTVDGEVELMRAHGIDVLVTKDSGGAQTAAKLVAARLLGVPVVVVRRPPAPAAETVDSVAAAAEWVRRGSGGA
ncbi:cobalt-precorrin-6A reductase [Umezawaea sp. Da 62-37]|nr:cobalt-precorrin-6A reductase [Umezawaea sp. Da 62-37]WNV91820.1 cobalt-precorrin-6A reductase [Umezawaea sp. Da 62-37]